MNNARQHRIAGDVTNEAYNGWRKCAEKNRVSVAALLEVLGRDLGRACRGDFTSAMAEQRLMQIVEQAAEIDRERKRRGN